MLTDPISDFLNRLRNASHARRRDVTVASSRMIKSIADVLMTKRFIESAVENTAETGKKELTVILKADREPLEVKRISKPGQRIYTGYNIKRVRSGLGLVIVSTSQGIMSGEEAKSKKIGGELICEIF